MKTIEWIYFRKGWASCKKAQKFFEQHQIVIETTVDARKEAMDVDAAWVLLSSAQRVVAVKSKTLKNLSVSDRNREEILKMSMGPSGNLRAPTFRVGEYYVVGFNEDMYIERLQSWSKPDKIISAQADYSIRERDVKMLTVTDEARNELKSILEQNPGKSLRVTMAGFGWGGPSLGLTLDESTDKDKTLMANEIEILVDAQVERFTDDQVIHYVQDGFTITATNGGGCSSCSGSCG